MSYLDVALACKDYIQVEFSRLQQRFYCLSNLVDFNDIEHLADVCFNLHISAYSIISLLAD